MIAVKMADEHCVDFVWIDARALQADQRRGAAIQQEAKTVGLDQDAGLKATAAPERITTS
jgi:hypothetical protein